ncbi:MAG: hypothetical protein DRO14_02575 [Thermoprotei archaeon]|nr:MAG: hypothetical protein DRO14_02575 [Thermoprotei archaeon]
MEVEETYVLSEVVLDQVSELLLDEACRYMSSHMIVDICFQPYNLRSKGAGWCGRYTCLRGTCLGGRYSARYSGSRVLPKVIVIRTSTVNDVF